MRVLSIYAILALWLIACNPTDKPKNLPIAMQSTSWQQQIAYASGFSIHYGPGYKWLKVNQPFTGATSPEEYLLLPHNTIAPDTVAPNHIIRIPVQAMVSTSTTHLPALDMLGVSNTLIGFANTMYITSEIQQERIKNGQLTDVGREQGINIEGLLALQPDIIMSYSMGPADATQKKLQRTGIPIVLNSDFLETTPLGRAEWIKFYAAFFNKERQADSVFKHIEREYNALLQVAKAAQRQPTVFSGLVYGDTWYVPGGKSWAARFLADAQANYLWANNDTPGSVALPFESVYAKAAQAPYWINVADHATLASLANADERYQGFKAWQSGQVYTYNARQNASGGNAYLELGYARPDLVLGDLIKIIHPELLADRELYFYKKLK